MEKKFKKGDNLYLAVKVCDVHLGGYDYTVEWKDVVDGGPTYASVGEGQLVSAEEVACRPNIDWQEKFNEVAMAASTQRKEFDVAVAHVKELQLKLSEAKTALSDKDAEIERLKAKLEEQKYEYVQYCEYSSDSTSELEGKLTAEKGNVEHWRKKYMSMKKSRNEYKRAADHLKEERDRADDELALTRIMNMALAEKIERLQNG